MKKENTPYFVFGVILLGVALFVLGVLLGASAEKSNEPEPENILGVATEFGCYKTIYSDKDLVREYWFLIEMNQEPAHLCILPQNFSAGN